jgi:hypothetical protein
MTECPLWMRAPVRAQIIIALAILALLSVIWVWAYSVSHGWNRSGDGLA